MSLTIELENIKDEVEKWLARVHYKDALYAYNVHASRSYALESSCSAVRVSNEIGLLARLSSTEIERLADGIRAFQNADGVFRDPLVKEEDRVNKSHPWQKIYDHMTGVALQTLALLGTSPAVKQKPPPLFDIAELDPEEWVRSFDHRNNPWGCCHNIAFSLLAYRRANGLENELDEKARICYRLIETELLNEVDGMPGAVDVAQGRRIAGYYMLTFCYLPFNRPLPNPESAVDAILSAATSEGEISEGGMCLNWDAAYVLNSICSELNWEYRHEEVLQLLRQLSRFLLTVHRKSDGGFSFYRDTCLEQHNFIRVSDPLPESDMIGTAMAVATLQIAAAIENKHRHETHLDPWMKSG
ncbi:MAG: hypothetical protein ACOCZS_02710 [Verrucomicrobiota bacterium]